MREIFSGERLSTAILSWTAGYVDTAGFLKLNGLFTAHVTGNLVVAGAEIAGTGGEAVWVRLAVIPIFIAAVILTTVFSRKQHPNLSRFLWFEAITLLVFTLVGITLIPIGNQPVEALDMFIAGSTGVFAMGVQNALMREAFGSLAPTTVMTGNLTQFTIDAARVVLIGNEEKTDDWSKQEKEIRQRIDKFARALVGFVLGAAFGAFFTSRIGFWSILLPTVAIIFLALNAQRHEARSSNAG